MEGGGGGVEYVEGDRTEMGEGVEHARAQSARLQTERPKPERCECDDLQRGARLSNLKACVVTQPRGVVRAAVTRRPEDPMITQNGTITAMYRGGEEAWGRGRRGKDMRGYLSWTLGYGPLDLGSSCSGSDLGNRIELVDHGRLRLARELLMERLVAQLMVHALLLCDIRVNMP